MISSGLLGPELSIFHHHSHQHDHLNHQTHPLTTSKVSNEVHQPVAGEELPDAHVVGHPLDQVRERGDQLKSDSLSNYHQNDQQRCCHDHQMLNMTNLDGTVHVIDESNWSQKDGELHLWVGGGLIGYVKNKPLGNGRIISIDALVIVMIIAVFHRKLI